MNLRRGDRGPEVMHLQSALVARGIPLPQYGVDGIYGAETEAAVTQAQQKLSLPVTEVAGRQLLARLGIDSKKLQTSPQQNIRGSALWVIGAAATIAIGIAIKKARQN